jgi:hypothetical protein
MVVTLEFAIDRTVIRKYDTSQENFKDALYMITPPHLKEAGLPFDRNILYSKKYIIRFWEFFFVPEEPEGLKYTGRFLDGLTVTNYEGNYNIIAQNTAKKRSLPNDPLTHTLAKIFRR